MIIGIGLFATLIVLLAMLHSNDTNRRIDIEKRDGKDWFMIDKDHNKTFIEKADKFTSIDRK
jgi:hypothetical protein